MVVKKLVPGRCEIQKAGGVVVLKMEGSGTKAGGGAFTAYTYNPPHTLTCTSICIYPPYMG